MSFGSVLVLLGASFTSVAGPLGSDEPSGRRMPWVHEEVHHRSPQDFAEGTFVRGSLAASSGLKLAPIEQPIGREDDGSASYVSAVLTPKQPFHELLASWNVEVPTGAGIWFDVRVGRKADDSWTDWLRVGAWGGGQPNWEATRSTGDAGVDVDYFKSATAYDLAQYRIVAWKGDSRGGDVKVARVDLTFSTRDGLAPADKARIEIPESSWKLGLAVPFRSQKSVAADLAPRVCSPTATAMVLEYHGVKRGTEEIAKRVFDAEHDLYGNWTRTIQGAYTFGVSGYLTRYADWGAVERAIAVGQPLVISIAAKPGELTGAPYAETAGHLIVVTGFDEHGDVLVHDPAGATAAEGVRTYRRSELDRCWLARGGTAYVFLAKR